jgi:hypothetical protein
MSLRDQEIVAQIKTIRVKNNSPWMELLLIALEHDRPRALNCARQILENDRGVNELLKILCEEE